jgi:hypothetical protein
MKPKKQLHGGPRENAGRPYKYGEATVIVTFRCPASKAAQIKSIIKAMLSQWK